MDRYRNMGRGEAVGAAPRRRNLTAGTWISHLAEPQLRLYRIGNRKIPRFCRIFEDRLRITIPRASMAKINPPTRIYGEFWV